MAWYSKEQHTRFDALPMDGLYFEIGDLQRATKEWTTGKKCPKVMFPSGHSYELVEASPAPDDVFVRLFDEIDLPYYGTRDYAFQRINDALSHSDRLLYFVHKIDEDGLIVWGSNRAEQLHITYDNEIAQLTNVIPLSDNAI